MAYIGKQPLVGNFIKLDAITASATDTYNLLNDSVAYTPQSAMNCIVSLNGVIQAPITAYTIVGTTIVFSETLSASDTIDFILVLGDVLDVGTVSDDTISTAKIKNLAVTAGKLAATQDLSTKTITLPASVSGLGTGITNAQLAGSITDAKITGLSSSKLSGALPAISGASLTGLTAGNITGTIPTANLGSGTASSSTFLRGDQTYAEAGGGKVLQIVQTVKTDTTSQAVSGGASWYDITGMSVAITPTAASSKILVMIAVQYSGQAQEGGTIQLQRDIESAGYTDIFRGDASGSRQRGMFNLFIDNDGTSVETQINLAQQCLDSPSYTLTDVLTYKLQWGGQDGTLYLNRDNNYTNSANFPMTISTITAIEIGA